MRSQAIGSYCALFQLSRKTALIQNDQTVELGRGDVALVDMSRPSSLSKRRDAQSLSLLLPRQPLISHLGFEPEGGVCGRGGTLATRLLYQIVRDAIEDETSLSAASGPYMQLAVYDLLGVLFAPSDPAYRHNDKLFAYICSIIKDRFTDPDLSASEVAARV